MQPMADHLGAKNYLCGGNVPCIADFILFEHIEATIVQTNTTFQRYPHLEAFHKRMANLPGLKEYMASAKWDSIKNIYCPKVPFVKCSFNPKTPE